MSSLFLPLWLFFLLLLYATLTTAEPCLTFSIPEHTSVSFPKFIPKPLCRHPTPPAYTWTSAQYSSEINRLLSGEEVSLPAPISGTPFTYAQGYQVMWLKEIQMTFDPGSLQQDLANNGFKITMTHGGTSTFQLGGKNYVVNHSKVVFSFLTQNPGGDDAMKTNNIAISPFTTWKMKLEPDHFSEEGFKALEKYKGQEIDLKFCGVINYFWDRELDGFKEVEDGKDRACYCEALLDLDGDKKCVQPLKCYTCSKKSCKSKKCDLQASRADRYAKDNTVDCYINYDGTGSEPSVEAGCKDFDKAAGPEDTICGVDTQQDWVGSKERKSCRCSESECNKDLQDLAKGVEIIEPKPETTTVADDMDGDDNEHHHKRPTNAGEALKMSWAGLVAFMGAVLCLF